jgi:hypothetical protein
MWLAKQVLKENNFSFFFSFSFQETSTLVTCFLKVSGQFVTEFLDNIKVPIYIY